MILFLFNVFYLSHNLTQSVTLIKVAHAVFHDTMRKLVSIVCNSAVRPAALWFPPEWTDTTLFAAQKFDNPSLTCWGHGHTPCIASFTLLTEPKQRTSKCCLHVPLEHSKTLFHGSCMWRIVRKTPAVIISKTLNILQSYCATIIQIWPPLFFSIH